MPILFDLAKYKNDYFIETGTYMGESIDLALASNSFKYIYSIEIDSLRHLTCKERYGTYKNVTLIKGDSGELLKLILKNINTPCTFWLDAHFCGDEAEYGKKWSPIIEELEAIKNHHIKNHTIIVDDYRCMDNTHFDKGRNIPVGFPGKKNLLKILQSINPDYSISFLQGAEPGDAVLARVEYDTICKNILNNIIISIEFDEKIPHIVDNLVNNILRESIEELENEGNIISHSIITDLVSSIPDIVDNKQKIWLKIKVEELELREKKLILQEQKKCNIMTPEEFDIIKNNLHELDETLLKKEEYLIAFEQRLKNKEEDISVREDTLQEIIIDLELQKDITKYQVLEKKALKSIRRGIKKRRNNRTTR